MTSQQPTTKAKPEAPSTLHQWFPGAVWLSRYEWGKFSVPDVIAAISVAALLVPESMGYATVAGVPVQVGLYAAPLGLIGYGVGEVGAGFLGGMVATGSPSKSSVAMAAGAKTQMANLFLAVVVLAVLLALSPALKWLPEAALAAVVITAMWGSANPARLTRIWAIDRVDFALGLITGLVVLAWDLLPAMITGIVLSIIYLVYKTSFPSRAELGRIEETGDYETAHWESGGHKGEGNAKAHPVPGVIVYRFDAPLVFSNAEAFKDTGRKLLIDAGAKGELPNTMVIDCEEMFYADITGAAALSDTFRYANRYGVELSLARLHTEARAILESAGTIDELGGDRVFDTVRNAVDAATKQRRGLTQASSSAPPQASD